MRKYYIDNLRWICILMLFIYHTFMIYNSFGENFYIKGDEIQITTNIMLVIWPWYMPLLFVISGISSAYALKRKTIFQYSKERFFKILIPLVSGLIFLIPIQTFYAEKFHNGYTDGFFRQYILFFSKVTDFTGYDGGFTPAHLWFLAYLFVISFIALPIMYFYNKAKNKINFDKLPVFALITFFIFPLLGIFVLNISGKSLGEYFAFFLLGFFILSDEKIIEKIEKNRRYFLILSIISLIPIILWWNGFLGKLPDIAIGIFPRFYAWVSILYLMGMGKHYLNFKNKITEYLSTASFPVYVFHQTWLIAIAYYVFLFTGNIILQMMFILVLSVLTTFATYELSKRFFVTRFLFGIKKPK